MREARERSRTDALLLLPLALRANAADFSAAHRDIDAAVARDLLLQLFVQLAFHFSHFSTMQTGDVNVVARAVAFVEVPVAAKVKQVELVDEPMAFQQIDRAIDGNARDVGIDFLRALEDFAGVEVAARGLHHLQKHSALAREPDSTGAKFALQASGRLVDVDSFSG